MAVSPLKFLRRVWRSQHCDGYAFLTWFDDEHNWDDQHFEVEDSQPSELALPNDGMDVYFAPCLFHESMRRKPYALPGRWLYADLDEVDPRTLEYLPPTVAWETSKGRYQAMWRLKESCPPEQLAELNQRVTYLTGADKGGWSLTKVLRVPGTTSTKHGYEWRIPLMWYENRAFSLRDIRRITRGTLTPSSVTPDLDKVSLPREKPREILRRYKLTPSIRKYLRAKEPRGDRSKTLWKLEHKLLDLGMSPEEVLVVVRATVWNKFKGQRREVRQLWTEINKVAAEKKLPASPNGKKRKKVTGRQLVSYDEFMKKRLPKPSWLVESIWSDKAHGVLAGEPKTYKSVIATDLAVSVASGARFLDYFPIPDTGPVMMIQEENDPGEVQDRLHRIAHSKALTGSATFKGTTLQLDPGTTLPISLMNNDSFNLTDEDDMSWLLKTVRRTKPKLIVLDPFYLMAPGINENSAEQVTPILRRLLKIKQEHGTGILLIHHYNKGSSEHGHKSGGGRISGTGVFWRWFESAVYVEQTPDDPTTVRMVPDHRGHAPQGVLHVTFDLGTPENSHYSAQVVRPKDEAAEEYSELHLYVEEAGAAGIRLSELAAKLGIGRPAAKRRATAAGFAVTKGSTSRGGVAPVIVKPKEDRD